MIRTLPNKLFVLVLAAASSITASLPATAFAQAAARPAEPAPASDGLTPQERDMLSAAEQLASEASQSIEQWITSQAITEARMFARLYFPIPKTDPQKYSTPYDTLADRDLVGPEDRALSRSPLIQYAIITDINAYVPAHNARFAQPLTGNLEKDYVSNRTKRLFGDPASLVAARSETRYLLQRVRLETGDLIAEVSVPVIVRGKHWGCARIGYRRTE